MASGAGSFVPREADSGFTVTRFGGVRRRSGAVGTVAIVRRRDVDAMQRGDVARISVCDEAKQGTVHSGYEWADDSIRKRAKFRKVYGIY